MSRASTGEEGENVGGREKFEVSGKMGDRDLTTVVRRLGRSSKRVFFFAADELSILFVIFG
ncbi:hypothetical protein SAMN05192532_10858 [Alteribacillus iranensis]|uniref:Uncharacterized protein n=1 Tax=Alteribacillus iranensis TaxID=930128 RepID=A0A1I2F2V3_9BACI|nr:hypothetical protein SAMN05192532_10858 [Alteribacillus iranensis]